MTTAYDINYTTICRGIICTGVTCYKCPLVTSNRFQFYLKELVHNNVITHEQLIDIANKEKDNT